MTSINITRRSILTGFLALFGSPSSVHRANAATKTPDASEGPFYPVQSMRRRDIDNNLVKIAGRVQKAGGEIINLRGRILDDKNNPLTDYRIEIWQTDMNGKYLHPGDDRNISHDQGFQGFGHDITDKAGKYSFRTIRPGKYPGRTPHIHVKVFNDQGREKLTTQFYEAGNITNKNDALYRAMSRKQAESVSMVYTQGPDGREAVVDITI